MAHFRTSLGDETYHSQESVKSRTMAFFTMATIRKPLMGNPTVVVLT